MKKERSENVILVKNTPFNVEEKDLSELFRRHGDVIRLVLPPTRTMALIEYSAVNEAKAAFKSLSYKNFNGKPLLLEMAPVGIFPAPPKSNKENKESISDLLEADKTESATLFVKNLNFLTSNDVFSKLFAGIEGFRSAKVSMKKNVKTGALMSMGFGFVEFASKESAKEAMKSFQVLHLQYNCCI